MLTAYYDLSLCPPTYDIVSFLLRVEQERLRVKANDCRVVFLPGPANGFRDDVLWPPHGERQRIFERIAAPMCTLLPSCVSVEMAKPGMTAQPVFGAGVKEYGLAKFVSAFSAVGGCLGSPITNLQPNPTVTMTLREADHWPERNSNVAEWLKAADRIAAMGFEVLLIRDRQEMDIVTRAAIYQSAVVNMFVCNGPAFMAVACDAPVLMFKPTCEDLGGLYSARHWAESGISPGGQIPGAGPHQNIVWDDDRADVIVNAFIKYGQLRKAA